jgi:hypothetical protein
VAFRSPDGRHLAAGSNGKVRVWDWEKNRPDDPVYIIDGPDSHSTPVAFTRDGRRLATDGSDGPTLWDAETGKLIRTFPADHHLVSALAFSQDGRQLASASLHRSVKLWDTKTGELLQSLPHTGSVLGVAFSPDGRRLASVGEDKTVHIWDMATRREVEVLGLRGHARHCSCVAFSPDPDGWRLASSGLDRTIRVWNATPLRGNEGQEVLTFTRHENEITSLAVSPGGDRILSASFNGLAKVWDVATGAERFGFPSHSKIVFAVAWHPGGQRIATAGSDGFENAV